MDYSQEPALKIVNIPSELEIAALYMAYNRTVSGGPKEAAKEALDYAEALINEYYKRNPSAD